ncbi:hypothetical protein Lfu02_65840 [Longispora fulva]|nr:hypothetical protein Lfu02_65840 [Longispora fulva]
MPPTAARIFETRSATRLGILLAAAGAAGSADAVPATAMTARGKASANAAVSAVTLLGKGASHVRSNGCPTLSRAGVIENTVD